MGLVTFISSSIAIFVVLVSIVGASLATTPLFDNNTNYLGFGVTGGAGGNGSISGKDLNEINSLLPASEVLDSKNFTATTLPVSKYMTVYAQQVMSELRRENAFATMKFSSPSEMKGGEMMRSEMMICPDNDRWVFVPVGHEDLAKAVLKDFASMPSALRRSSTKTQIWFSSFGGSNVGAGHTFEEVAYASREEMGNPENNAYLGTITVYGVNGTPQSLSRGDLAHGLAHELDGMNNRFSRGDATTTGRTVGPYPYAIVEDLKAHPNNSEYVSDYAADYESTHFGETSQYSEDFAEAVQLFVTDRDNFTRTYPNRAAYLTKILES